MELKLKHHAIKLVDSLTAETITLNVHGKLTLIKNILLIENEYRITHMFNTLNVLNTKELLEENETN